MPPKPKLRLPTWDEATLDDPVQFLFCETAWLLDWVDRTYRFDPPEERLSALARALRRVSNIAVFARTDVADDSAASGLLKLIEMMRVAISSPPAGRRGPYRRPTELVDKPAVVSRLREIIDHPGFDWADILLDPRSTEATRHAALVSLAQTMLALIERG